MSDLDGQKRALRRELRAQRAALPEAERAAASARICEAIEALPAWASATVVAIFLPLPAEVDLRALIGGERRFALPVVLARHQPLVFRAYRDGDPLVASTFGVAEPTDAAPHVPLDAIDLVVVPALSIDDLGLRLGYGGGFYDRTLPLMTRATRVGACFEALRRHRLPAGDLDEPLHVVVSEASTRTVEV